MDMIGRFGLSPIYEMYFPPVPVILQSGGAQSHKRRKSVNAWEGEARRKSTPAQFSRGQLGQRFGQHHAESNPLFPAFSGIIPKGGILI
jgi:hypothetical protein